MGHHGGVHHLHPQWLGLTAGVPLEDTQVTVLLLGKQVMLWRRPAAPLTTMIDLACSQNWKSPNRTDFLPCKTSNQQQE